MKSPFPGMDPYLETSWGDVHTSLVTYTRNQLNRQMPPGVRARVEESVAVEVDDPTDDEVVTYFPDVQILSTDRGSGTATAPRTAEATEALVIARKPEPDIQRSIRIVTADGNKLITTIEFLSPSNKIGKTGRDDYRDKQAELLRAGVSLVEVDLIRAGRHVLALGLTRLPRRYRTGYKIVVTRGWRRDQSEFYPASIRVKLPTIRIPLRQTDPDAVLDLQEILDMAYADGGYDSIDYRGRLEPDLPAEDRPWVDELLKTAGKR